MRCPSCGAVYDDIEKQCPLCRTVVTNCASTSKLELQLETAPASNSGETDSGTEVRPPGESRKASRLIEFPSQSRTSVPQWRKELSERVREVQEKRARKAAVEAEEAERIRKEQAPLGGPQLGLLTQADVPSLNPLVAAALRRIERARPAPLENSRRAAAGGSVRTGFAYASARDNGPSQGSSQDRPPTSNEAPATNNEIPAELARAIVSSSPQTNSSVDSQVDCLDGAERSHSLVVIPSVEVSGDTEVEAPGLRRLIVDDPHDPALSYLDSLSASPTSRAVSRLEQAPILSRVTADLVDLLTVAFLSSPIAAIIELQDGNWQDPGVMVLMSAVVVLIMFGYLTISTAMTGRTWGMSLMSLKTVDEGTGLIPTGKQSAGRAALYIGSLASLGVGVLYAVIEGRGRTVHDYLTRTAVVRG